MPSTHLALVNCRTHRLLGSTFQCCAFSWLLRHLAACRQLCKTARSFLIPCQCLGVWTPFRVSLFLFLLCFVFFFLSFGGFFVVVWFWFCLFACLFCLLFFCGLVLFICLEGLSFFIFYLSILFLPLHFLISLCLAFQIWGSFEVLHSP